MPGIEDITMAGSGNFPTTPLIEDDDNFAIISEKSIIHPEKLKISTINSNILKQIEQTSNIEKNMSIIGRVCGWILFTSWNGHEENRQFKKVSLNIYCEYLSKKTGETKLRCRKEVYQRIKQIFVID